MSLFRISILGYLISFNLKQNESRPDVNQSNDLISYMTGYSLIRDSFAN